MLTASGAKFAYYLGLDLGQAQDYTALAVLEEPLWLGGRWVSPQDMSRTGYRHARAESDRARPPNPPLSVRHLERFELVTRYPEVVERVRELARTPPLASNH